MLFRIHLIGFASMVRYWTLCLLGRRWAGKKALVLGLLEIERLEKKAGLR